MATARGDTIRPRILQVITDTDRRGAQIFAMDLHEALQRNGESVCTVALHPGAFGGLDVPTMGRNRLELATLRALRSAFRSADVVVAHGSSTLPACAIASVGTRVPFVYRQISDSLFWAPTRLRRVRVRLGLARANRVVALWDGAAETLETRFGVAATRIDVIPNAVPSRSFHRALPEDAAAHRVALGLHPDRRTVAYIGALASEKGVDVAIDAVSRLRGVQLVVAGSGPERGALEDQARSSGGDNVVFLGTVLDPGAVLGAADVVVLPSRGGDSMPAVLIEAGLSGLPAVATPIQGVPEIVVDGVTGHLVPIGSAEALAAAIEQILDDPEYAARLGDAARRRCLERFDIRIVAAQWQRVLTGLTDGGDGRQRAARR